MKVQDIKNVAVIGAGLMGHGIAQEFAMAGYKVGINDLSEDLLNKAMDDVQRNLGMMKTGRANLRRRHKKNNG